MEHSKQFELIKKLYNAGIYSYEQVELFKNKGVITEEEFIEITQEN